MKVGAAFLLVVFTLSQGLLQGSLIVDRTLTETETGTAAGTVEQPSHSSNRTSASPAANAIALSVFGDTGSLLEESALAPLSAVFKHLHFTGSDRPRSVFEDEGAPAQPLVENGTANLRGKARPLVPASPLNPAITEGPHALETEAAIQVVARIVDHDGVENMMRMGATGIQTAETTNAGTFSGELIVDEESLFVSDASIAAGDSIIAGSAVPRALQSTGVSTLSVFDEAPIFRNAVSRARSDATFETESATDTLSLRGVVTDAGQLVVEGPGGAVMSGKNSYSGSTIITSGTVVVSSGVNPLGTGSVTVESGATLRLANASLANVITFNPGSRLLGNGSISSATLRNGVTISPGAFGAVSVGTLSFNDLTLTGGGNMEWTLQDANAGPGTGWDLVTVTSPTTLMIGANTAGRFNLKLFSSDGQVTGQSLPTGFDPNQAASWLIFSTSGIEIAGGGTLADSFAIDATNFGGISSDLFTLTRENNDLFLTFTPVPEPSTYGLLTLGLAALGLRAWRRKR